MLVWNYLTNEKRILEVDVAQRWAQSCTPWLIVNQLPTEKESSQKSSSNTVCINPDNYNPEKINHKSLNQFWNSNLTFVRSAMIARSLKRSMNKLELSNTIWTQTLNNEYAVAVIEWCKVFGTDSEEYHWKNVFGTSSPFITDLLSDLGISQKTYNNYWTEMTNARAKRIAHSNLNGEPDVPLPDFNLAINIAESTHAILMQLESVILRKALIKSVDEAFKVNPMCFETWKSNLQDSIERTIKPALEATKAVTD